MPNLDQPAALFLLGFSITLAVVCTIALCRAAGKPRPVKSLPGSLGSSRWTELDDWEEHVRTAPGIGEIGETPIFDGLCFEEWEREVSDEAAS
jgi:hypothetical protein